MGVFIMPIPNYLDKIVKDVKNNGTWTCFSMVCICGCDKFFLFKNFYTTIEKEIMKPYFDALHQLFTMGPVTYMYDENGEGHWVKLKDNKPTDVIDVPDAPSISGIEVIKIKCSHCGREYVLFDNRFNGYDGVFVKEKDISKINYEAHFKQIKINSGKSVGVNVKVENDESLEVFIKNTGVLDCDTQTYSNAFSWICVYAVTEKGKRKVFDFESA